MCEAVTATENKRLYNKAYAAGLKAGNAKIPTPMIVGSPTTPLGSDIDPNKKTYFVPQGVCGFAWVKVVPGTCSFARWLTKTGKGRPGYGGGTHVWVHEFGQSLEQKEAFARAFAQVLTEAGVTAYSQSRMD